MAFRLLTATAALMLAAFAAHAEAYPVCEIVVAWDRPSKHEILAHEMAHCNGWPASHPTSDGVSHAAHTGRRGPGYKAYDPPAEFAHPYPGQVILRRVSTSRATRICGGTYGCAMGGLLP